MIPEKPTVEDLESNGPDASPHHRFLVIVKSDRLMIEREGLELVVEEEVNSLLSQFESETLEERDVVIDEFVVFEVQRGATH